MGEARHALEIQCLSWRCRVPGVSPGERHGVVGGPMVASLSEGSGQEEEDSLPLPDPTKAARGQLSKQAGEAHSAALLNC